MPKLTRTDLDDLRGVSRMAVDAVAGVTDIVERMHTTILQLPPPVGAPRARRSRGITGLVYRGVRGGVRLIGTGVDALLASSAGLLPESGRTRRRETMVAIANGIYGDYFARTSNRLAVTMSLRYRGHVVDASEPAPSLRQAGAPPPASRILVLMHGLCMSDLQWCRDGQDHGVTLAEQTGCSAIYVRYNTGLHIHENGRSFDRLMESLVRNWPVPVQEVCIIGHSMGGLVARSACDHASARESAWLARLGRLVFLGTPHFGAPLERGGRWVDFALQLSPYSAPLARVGKTRSAGIRDLRHGTVTIDGRHPPLPRGVRCYAAAAVIAKKRSLLAERLIGDGLVPLNSALGRHHDRSKALGIPKAHQWIAYEAGHLDLLRRPEVYRQLRLWLDDGRLAESPADRPPASPL